MAIGVIGGIILGSLVSAALSGILWIIPCGYILAAILAAICELRAESKLRAGRKKEATRYPQW